MQYHYLKKERELMIRTYKEIQAKLSELDFNLLYSGFHIFDFALYNKSEVILNDEIFPYTEDFIGNTTIRYSDKQIAIWDMKYSVDDIDIFTSKIIHEMFHAYQMENKESRFPNEFNGIFYKYNHENMIWKTKESKLLVDAYDSGSEEKFKQFIASRKERSKKYPKEVNYENKVETVEGLARLMELNSLHQLNEKLEEQEIQITKDFLSKDENYLPIRKLSLFLGSFIVLTANKLGLNYEEKKELPVVDWFKSGKFKESLLDKYIVKTSYIDSYHQKNKQLVEDFLSQELIEINDVNITGLDPMNTIKYNDYLLFNHFIRVKSKLEEKNYFGLSCMKLNNETKKHQLYIKKK